MYRTSVLILLACLMVAQPSLVLAQVTPPINSGATNQTLQRYNPNIQTGIGSGSGGNGFQGVNFSGVGGALASCLNIGQGVLTLTSRLLGRGATGFGSIASQQVPVSDSATQKKLETQNQTINCLNGVAYAVAKNMLQQVTDRTLSWINTGFNGNPFYVRDIDSYLKSIQDQKIATFLQNATSTDPIFGNALRSTITSQVTGYDDGRIGLLMNTPEAQEYQRFQDDFTNGGWSAFLNPRNNAIGAYFNAVDNLSGEISTAQENTRQELIQGQGFLDMKKCVEWSSTITADTVRNDCTGQYFNQRDAELAQCNTRPNQILKDSCIQGVTTKYDGLIRACINTATQVEGATATCTRYETVTPGSVISEQAAAVTTTQIRQLEAADSINEVLGAFFDQLLNRLFNKGIGGTQQTADCAYGTGIGCTIDNQSISGAQSALGYEASNGSFNGDFDISRPQQMRAIIKTQKDFINRATDAQIVLNQVTPRVGALDYCFPGPNPTWQNGLADNMTTFMGYAQSSGNVFALFTNVKNPLLYDKTTANTQQISTVTIEDDLEDVTGWLTGSFTALVNELNANYDQTLITTKFMDLESTAQNKLFAKGFVRDTIRETQNLAGYSQNTALLNEQYSTTLDDTELAVEELEDIYNEINQIVGTAKTRYIAAQAAAGTPVNLACINTAYKIDTTPIVGAAREEPDGVIDPFAVQSQAAHDYFYSNL